MCTLRIDGPTRGSRHVWCTPPLVQRYAACQVHGALAFVSLHSYCILYCMLSNRVGSSSRRLQPRSRNHFAAGPMMSVCERPGSCFPPGLHQAMQGQRALGMLFIECMHTRRSWALACEANMCFLYAVCMLGFKGSCFQHMMCMCAVYYSSLCARVCNMSFCLLTALCCAAAA